MLIGLFLLPHLVLFHFGHLDYDFIGFLVLEYRFGIINVSCAWSTSFFRFGLVSAIISFNSLFLFILTSILSSVK